MQIRQARMFCALAKTGSTRPHQCLSLSVARRAILQHFRRWASDRYPTFRCDDRTPTTQSRRVEPEKSVAAMFASRIPSMSVDPRLDKLARRFKIVLFCSVSGVGAGAETLPGTAISCSAPLPPAPRIANIVDRPALVARTQQRHVPRIPPYRSFHHHRQASRKVSGQP